MVNPAESERFLRLLFGPEDFFQILGFHGKHGKTIRGVYQGDFQAAARDAAEMSSDYRADVFYSLNPLRPDSPLTASRTLNRAVNSSQAADHGDILGRHRMLVDFDPVRESNTASTPIQKAESLVVAGRVQDYLKSFGFPDAILNDSGNGNHIVSRLDGTPIATGLIRSILKHLQSQFGSDMIDIDLSVANLARVARLPGTINRKGGACSPASVLSYPDTFTPVPRETLLRVARLGGYSTQQEALDAPGEGETPSVDDMLELICRDYSQELALDTASHEDGSEYFYLSHCPFVGRRHEGSNRKSTFIVIRPTGKVGFQCYAGKCASKGFGALLRLLWRRTGKRPSVPVLAAMLDAASEIPDSVAAKWGLLEPEPPPSSIAIIAPVEVATRRVFAGTPSSPRPRLWLDFETASEEDLKVHGLDRYLGHPSTRQLLLAYAYGADDVKVLDLTDNPALPEPLASDIANCDYQKVAWNVPFDSGVLSTFFGIPIDLRDWLDPSALARTLHLGASLADACKDLNMTEDQAKDKRGEKLKNLFCYPQQSTKSQIAAGLPAQHWITKRDRPEEWEDFKLYAARDVTSMRLAMRRMESLRPFPDSEHELWRFDQGLNRRGIPVDLSYVREAIKLSEAADIETMKALKGKTALENPNSDDQIKSWLDANGYPMASIAKELVDEALVDKKLPAPVREVLELRERLSGAGPSKLYAITNRICADGKLRNEIKYGGAHTMRASSSGMQIHNIPKPTRLVSKRVAELTESIRSGHGIPEGLDPIEVITGTLRSSLCASPGNKFITGDFKSVENRGLAWISGCVGMLDIFLRGIDPYKSFAALLYNKPYEDVTDEERNQTKAVVLGAGYGMGARKLLRMARKGGVILTLPEAKKHLEVFHAAYPEIRIFHKALETAAKQAIKYKQDVAVGRLLLKGSDRRYLEILLPSGRSMFYQRPRLSFDEYGDGAKITYIQSGKKGTYGAMLAENVVQGIARDLLYGALLACERAGLEVCFHVHDEIVISASEENASAAKSTLDEIMSRSPDWAPDLPLAVESKIVPYFQK